MSVVSGINGYWFKHWFLSHEIMDQYLHLSEKSKADEHKIEIKESVFSFITFSCITLYLSSITKIVFALRQLLKA